MWKSNVSWSAGLMSGALVLCLAGCSEPADPPGESAVAAEPTVEVEEGAMSQETNIEVAERFIDAFYSFDPERLSALLTAAESSAEGILYYQGWAEGGNYKVVKRGPCVAESDSVVVCPITVDDDPVLALNTGFKVTDTFTLTFEDGKITNIDTSSDDQPIYYKAREWVKANMPEVMEGPCKDMRDGGKTPGDCARAMTEGYRRFAATEEYAAAMAEQQAAELPDAGAET